MTLAEAAADDSIWNGLFRYLLGAGVIGGVVLLWKITLNTSLMAKAFEDHEKRIARAEVKVDDLHDWKIEAKPQLHTLYHNYRAKRQQVEPEKEAS